jgi:CBS domain-containing protein
MRQLSDIVRDQKPLTLPPSATVKEACQSMSDRHLGAVLITEKPGRLVGIFTGRDAVCRVLAAGKSPAKTRLRDVMTASPVAMSPDRTVIEALRLTWDGGFRHVPVINDDKVIGVARFILDPGHAGFVGSHVRSWNVVSEIADRLRE